MLSLKPQSVLTVLVCITLAMYAMMFDAVPPGMQLTSAIPTARPGGESPQYRLIRKPMKGSTVYCIREEVQDQREGEVLVEKHVQVPSA